jgi:6-phosphogluconate dehydrogenase
MPIMINIKSNGHYLKGISQEISQAKIEMVIKGFKLVFQLTNISGISIEEISALFKENNLL